MDIWLVSPFEILPLGDPAKRWDFERGNEPNVHVGPRSHIEAGPIRGRLGGPGRMFGGSFEVEGPKDGAVPGTIAEKADMVGRDAQTGRSWDELRRGDHGTHRRDAQTGRSRDDHVPYLSRFSDFLRLSPTFLSFSDFL